MTSVRPAREIPGPRDDARIRFTRIGEGLSLAVVDVEQPLPPTGDREAHGGALAAVEDVRRLVDDEVGEGIGDPGRGFGDAKDHGQRHCRVYATLNRLPSTWLPI
jgi:hypothetical protein